MFYHLAEREACQHPCCQTGILPSGSIQENPGFPVKGSSPQWISTLSDVIQIQLSIINFKLLIILAEREGFEPSVPR